MGAVMRYTMQAAKTLWNDRKLISGVNCQPQMVYQDFLSTKRLYHKTDGKQFYHMVQSFHKGAQVDPVTAHAAALELAKYYSGYEVLVCTHVDREHIHSHFIINSVNCETGHKLHIAKDQLQELRQRNDEVCAQFSLPVFEQTNTPRKTRSMTIGEYHLAAKGQSKKLQLMNVINDCMCHAASYEQFVALMESEGYKVQASSRRRSLTFISDTGWQCRDFKLFGDKYLKENILHEFTIRTELIYGRADGKESPHTYAGAADGIGRTDAAADSHRTDPGASAADPSDAAYGDPLRAAERGSTVGAQVGEDGGHSVMAEQVPASDLGAHTISDSGADGRAAEDTEAFGNDGRTGWEAEREAFFASKAQTAQASTAQLGRSYGGDSGWDLAGIASALHHAIQVSDSDDPEERRRRIEARIEAENFGMAVGAAIGLAAAVSELRKNKQEQEPEETEPAQDENIWQQTM